MPHYTVHACVLLPSGEDGRFLSLASALPERLSGPTLRGDSLSAFSGSLDKAVVNCCRLALKVQHNMTRAYGVIAPIFVKHCPCARDAAKAPRECLDRNGRLICQPD